MITILNEDGKTVDKKMKKKKRFMQSLQHLFLQT